MLHPVPLLVLKDRKFTTRCLIIDLIQMFIKLAQLVLLLIISISFLNDLRIVQAARILILRLPQRIFDCRSNTQIFVRIVIFMLNDLIELG